MSLEFWKFIDEGCNYLEGDMFDYASKSFAKAEPLKNGGSYLIEIIRMTRNFHYIFRDNEEEFETYFGSILLTIQKANNGEIDSDIFEYIIIRLIDLKEMFIKTVAKHFIALTYQSECSVIILFDKFKDYLIDNKDKIINILGNANSKYKISEQDIDTVIMWIYNILLTDGEINSETDKGWIATTTGDITTIRQNIHYSCIKYPRIKRILKENYSGVYIRELTILFEKYEKKQTDILKFQQDFQQRVYLYVDYNCRSMISYEPFIKKNILTLSTDEHKLFPYILLCLFLGYLGIHSFYIGLNKKGTIQLILTLTGIGYFITLPWVIYDLFRALIKKEIPKEKRK